MSSTQFTMKSLCLVAMLFSCNYPVRAAFGLDLIKDTLKARSFLIGGTGLTAAALGTAYKLRGKLITSLGTQHEKITLTECDNKTKDLYKKFLNATDNCIVIYVPGTGGNGAIAGRYTIDSEHLETGEHITSLNGLQLLSKNLIVADGGEIINRPVPSPSMVNPLNWPYRAWISFGCYVANRYSRSFGITIKPSEKPNKSGYSINGHTLKKDFSLGFGVEMENVIAAFKKAVAMSGTKNIIFFGDSRGTASIVNALPELIKIDEFKTRVKAIILEGCIDSAENVYYKQGMLTKLIPFGVINWLSKTLIGVDQFINKPSKIAEKLTQEQIRQLPPICIIGSKGDEVLTYETIENFYKAWEKAFLAIYEKKDLEKYLKLIKLNNSRHIYYAIDDAHDREIYFKSIHEFYKNCKLPYIEQG